MGLVHHMVCSFAHQLLLVLINQRWRDGTLGWRWYTAAAGDILNLRLLAVITLYHTATSAPSHELF